MSGRSIVAAERRGVEVALEVVRDTIASVVATNRPGASQNVQLAALRTVEARLRKIIKCYDEASAEIKERA